MGKITIIIKHLGLTDIGYALYKQIENLKKEYDVSILYEENVQPFFNFPCSKLSIGRLWQDQTNDGIIIATSLYSAELVYKLTNLKRKIFYVWDLEFLWNKKDFLENQKIFNMLPLVTRSESYASCISNYCNIQPSVINDFNLKEIIDEYRSV